MNAVNNTLAIKTLRNSTISRNESKTAAKGPEIGHAESELVKNLKELFNAVEYNMQFKNKK